MPVTDVMQMMGRAGRPQFDVEGVAVVMVEQSKKNFYKVKKKNYAKNLAEKNKEKNCDLTLYFRNSCSILSLSNLLSENFFTTTSTPKFVREQSEQNKMQWTTSRGPTSSAAWNKYVLFSLFFIPTNFPQIFSP